MTKILIVEDHALVREAMVQRLARLEPGLVCLESAGTDEALAVLEFHADVDLAVVDLMLPDKNGFSLLAVLAKRFPDLPAIVVSAVDDEASVRRALAAGASGFVSKASSGDVLAQAVQDALAGDMPTPPRAHSGGRQHAFTAGQARVVELLAAGCSNREIADRLGLTEGTVKVHMTAIYRVLGVSSRTQALVSISRSGVRL